MSKGREGDPQDIKSGEIYCYGCRKIFPLSESHKHGFWCHKTKEEKNE